MTFKVTQFPAPLGAEITGIDLGSLDPVRLELPPTHGTLSEGQGLTFELELQD